ncbi:hypothetical protein RRG08_062285 [Elysia crispata]|uniref:Uncharacterized protein n=1 Tax=Elysia crispata TaxID=231223 RepID=A0AAE1CYA2_9GAST|nr:hypothetical protein RRG08_062285 [Elysia crispata]
MVGAWGLGPTSEETGVELGESARLRCEGGRKVMWAGNGSLIYFVSGSGRPSIGPSSTYLGLSRLPGCLSSILFTLQQSCVSCPLVMFLGRATCLPGTRQVVSVYTLR